MADLRALEQRFWSRVWECTHRRPCKKCCWPWKCFDYSVNTAPIWEKHASFSDPELQQRSIPAHRFAFEIRTGSLTFRSQDFPLCHQCDFGPCCNPYHLAMGSKSDNLRGSHGLGHRRNPVQLPNGSVWLYAEAVLTYLQEWARTHGYMPEWGYRRASAVGILLGEAWKREWEVFPHWIPPWTSSKALRTRKNFKEPAHV